MVKGGDPQIMKRTISILAALLCMALFRFIPAPAGMTSSAIQVLGIFVGALILWMTISIDWPSMLVTAALVTVPELSMNAVFFGYFLRHDPHCPCFPDHGTGVLPEHHRHHHQLCGLYGDGDPRRAGILCAAARYVPYQKSGLWHIEEQCARVYTS